MRQLDGKLAVSQSRRLTYPWVRNDTIPEGENPLIKSDTKPDDENSWIKNDKTPNDRDSTDSFDSTQRNSTFPENQFQSISISRAPSIHQSKSVARTSTIRQLNSVSVTSPKRKLDSMPQMPSVNSKSSFTPPFTSITHIYSNENAEQR